MQYFILQLVNAYASGNTGAIRQALNSYVATVNNYIDSIVTLATNPGALKYSVSIPKSTLLSLLLSYLRRLRAVEVCTDILSLYTQSPTWPIFFIFHTDPKYRRENRRSLFHSFPKIPKAFNHILFFNCRTLYKYLLHFHLYKNEGISYKVSTPISPLQTLVLIKINSCSLSFLHTRFHQNRLSRLQ